MGAEEMERDMTRFKIASLAASIMTVGAMALAASPAAAVTSIDSSSYGVFVDLSILSLINVGVGPVAPANGTAPAAYNNTNSVASLTSTTSLIALPLVTSGLDLNTGIITNTASSPFTGSSMFTGTAMSTVDGLNSNLGLSVTTGLLPPVITSLLNISATTIIPRNRALAGPGCSPRAV